VSGPAARLSSGTRLALALLVSLILAGLVATGIVARAGIVEVEVVEAHGDRVSIAAPGTIVLAVARLVPGSFLDSWAGELEPYWPAIHRISRELATCPDGVFVQADGSGLRMRIAKERGHLVIDVEDQGDRVHVAVPVGVVTSLVDRVERGAHLL
jgi:hypothetical protein